MDNAGLRRLVKNGSAGRRHGRDSSGVTGSASRFRGFGDGFQAALHGAIALRVRRGFTNILLC